METTLEGQPARRRNPGRAPACWPSGAVPLPGASIGYVPVFLAICLLAGASWPGEWPWAAGTLVAAAIPDAQAGAAPPNLALRAGASAFEDYQGMVAGLANDGNPDSRWSGIPGHNRGGWYELRWDQPVQVGEVLIFQHDRYVMEMDLQAWDAATQGWITLEHLGHPDRRLPKVVGCRFPQRATTRLRLANITNGPSFTEVQVFEKPYSHPPQLSLASDVDGHFIGIVSDAWGSAPVAGVEVGLSGQSAAGPWQATARSDEFGFFQAPMPMGLRGRVLATAAFPGTDRDSAARQDFDAAGFQYGLTPDNELCRKTSLDGEWRFMADPPAGFWEPAFDDRAWPMIQVPGHFEMQGFQSVEGIGGCRKSFRAPAGPGRLKLRFEGVYSGAEVWLNGRRLAWHEGGALPFEVDITEAAAATDNLLAVRVVQHTLVSDQLDKMSEYADFPLAGIMRPVACFRVPNAHIGAAALDPKFDSHYRDAELAVRLAVINESGGPLAPAALEFRLSDPEGRPVPITAPAASVQAGPWQRVETQVVLAVGAPRHWEAEHPNCYRLEIILRSENQVLDRLVQKIGFRQTDIRGGQLLINGQPVKIRGTCHHDSHPLLGRAVTEELTRRDLELMKEASLNSLRTSHYPPFPALLKIADELGIYVEDEGSFCWVAAGIADDLRVTPRIMQLNAELLARDRNHPSVFVWSLCNESAFGYGFERSHQWLRAADPARPNAGSYDRGSLEIHARHNPIALPDLVEMEKMTKPVLWDEAWCIYQGIFRDVAELWVDPGMRDYYAEPLGPVYERMMRARSIAGTQIWAWSDDIFCVPNRGLEYGRGATRSHFIENQYRLPGRGLVGDAPWGVVDGWRRKKPEFWITKKLQSPVRIKELPLAVPSPGGTLRLPVENQYDFTDLSELRVEWRIGHEQGVAQAAGRPHQTGHIEIRPLQAPAAGQVLRLDLKDAQGRLVDAFQLPFGPFESPLPQLQGPASGKLRIVPDTALAGPGRRVVGPDFDFLFDESTGALRRGVVFGQALLLELPRLHILPASTPMHPLPEPLTWSLRQLEIQPAGENIQVRCRGAYAQLDGGYDLTITPGGFMVLRSAFTYTGEKLVARELGLALSVPRECDSLRWSRRAEWGVYPEDHIGRPLGAARAFAGHPEQLPPGWPWAADNSPMGCNDFRSTKRHIEWASLGYPDGPGLWVESGGSQHVRAQVQTDRIAFYINDWYGGTCCGLGEWTSNYGEGKTIATGDRLESTLRLRLAKRIGQ